MSGKRIIVGISGADGVSLGVRLLSMLRGMEGVETLLIMSRAAERNLEIECRTAPEEVRALANRWYEPEDMAAEVSSGSFWTDGMIVAPCSMKTLAAIAHGYSENLLVRAADVCLKEGRKVVLMPRETPLGIIHHQKHARRSRGRLRHRAAHADVLQPAREPGRGRRPRARQGADAVRAHPAGL